MLWSKIVLQLDMNILFIAWFDYVSEDKNKLEQIVNIPFSNNCVTIVFYEKHVFYNKQVE